MSGRLIRCAPVTDEIEETCQSYGCCVYGEVSIPSEVCVWYAQLARKLALLVFLILQH